MSDKALTYINSQQLRKDLTYAKLNWANAEDQYKQGAYFDSLCTTIGYIDEAIGQQFKTDAAKGVKILHGSVQLHIALNDGKFQVVAPFINISNALKIVVLRKICELNFFGLNLARIECREDILAFKYECLLEACEPWKIYEVLREICWIADKHDDNFVVLQKAAWITEPEVTPFSDQRKEQSWNGLRLYLQEAREWISYWQGRGNQLMVWDVIYVTLMKIEQLCSPQGIIKNVLESNIEKLFDKRDLNDVLQDGLAYLDSLEKITQSAFYTQLYDVATFVPVKVSAGALNVQNSLKTFLDNSYDYIKRSEMTTAYLCLQKGIFRLFYNYRLNELQWNHLQVILSGLNNLSIADAANALYRDLNAFYNDPMDRVPAPVQAPVKEKTGLFAGWFS
jgi:hypothetical protein